MLSSNKLSKRCTAEIGNLFYALSKADRAIDPKEQLKLKKILRTNWGHYGSQITSAIESRFKEAEKHQLDPESCFSGFILYLKKHPMEFSENLKRLILKSCNDLAYASAKINKSELHYLARLDLEFKKRTV